MQAPYICLAAARLSILAPGTYMQCNIMAETGTMTTLAFRNEGNSEWVRSAFGGFFDGMSLISAARECSRARRERRTPSRSALHSLGIDETAFERTYKRR